MGATFWANSLTFALKSIRKTNGQNLKTAFNIQCTPRPNFVQLEDEAHCRSSTQSPGGQLNIPHLA